MGISGCESFQKIIDTHHVVIQNPALAVLPGIHIRNAAVHIPFHILDIPLVQHGAYTVKDIFLHVLPGKIQHQLIPAPNRPSARNPQRPVRMGPVQLAVLGYHLRLHPDTELHPQGIDSADHLPQCAAQFFLVHGPVSQAAVVIVPLSEPSVVHDHHIHAKSRRIPGQGADGLPAEVKIGSLPAVQQHRARFMGIFSPADMIPDTAVEHPGQCPQSLLRMAQNGLRHGEALPGIQGIVKQLIGKSHEYPGLVKLIPLRLTEEISAVDENHPPTASRVLCGPGLRQDNRRIVLMTGSASAAAHAEDTVVYPCPLEIPLHGMPPVKAKQVIFPRDKIQTGRSRFLHGDFTGTAVSDHSASGDDIFSLQHPVQKPDLHFAHRVFQKDFQSLRLLLLCIHRRKPLQAILPLPDLMAHVAQIAAFRAVPVPNRHCAAAEVPDAQSGILLGQHVHGVSPV